MKSSSEGNVVTKGVLSGYFPLAISSTSFSVFPIATISSPTTAIALWGYFFTSEDGGTSYIVPVKRKSKKKIKSF
jgi:hypothetical protein